jgi:hypothetical protein
MELDQSSAITVGAVLLAVIAVGYGGTFLLNVVTGRAETNDLQKSFFRAGHAHAGVLITLGLLVVVVTSTDGVPGWAHEFSSGVLYAAILMPAGFFLSVIGHDPQRPNRLIILLWLGVVSLTIGLLAAGIGLIMAGVAG